ncbi:GntR family transcriptional regulator [Pinisolibacter sp.]|uniref:GntR family transcriptional regulator n=1 Tax=Pinisolibacter sp. TaxID=2172024 RepID=UPI002FDEE3B7
MNEQAPPQKLREKAYARFTDRLLSRELRPGQFVSQRELVEITGMPLGAIREIVPRLEVEGLIRTVPQRGMQVAHIDVNLIREAYQFRLFMEREAVMDFAVSAPDAVVADLIRQHREVLDEVVAHGETAESEARAQALDWGMHDTIIDGLGNAIISKAYRVNSIKMRLIAQERYRIEGRVAPVMREHLAVLEAIAARDPQKAAAAITFHIGMARELALKV